MILSLASIPCWLAQTMIIKLQLQLIGKFRYLTPLLVTALTAEAKIDSKKPSTLTGFKSKMVRSGQMFRMNKTKVVILPG